MYMKRFWYAFMLLAICLTSCDKTDDLWDEVNDLKKRVTSLETQIKDLNWNIEAIRELCKEGATITSVELKDGTYTIKLSDGQTLKLVEKNDANALFPMVGVDAEGYWTVSYDNGKTYSQILDASNKPVKATGENGVTPKFRVDANTGYWEVSYDGGANYETVKDTNGNPVNAVGGSGGGGSSTDKFFKDVKVVNNELQITMLDDTKLTIPIISSFYCRFAPDITGVQSFAEGETKTFNVEIKGVDNTMITAPNGWTASLGEADNNNIAILTVTAPKATPQTRATADTSKDIAILATSGAYASIAKIQVEIKALVDYYTIFQNGDNIIVGGVTINKNTYPTATILSLSTVDEEIAIDTHINKTSTPVILFIDGSMNFTTTGVKGISQPVLIIGRYPEKQSTLKINNCWNLINGQLLFKNIQIDMASINNVGSNTGYLLNNANSTGDFSDLVFDDCNLINVQKPLCYLNLAANGIHTINIENTQIAASAGATPLISIAASNALNAYKSFTFENNVVYSATPINGQIIQEPTVAGTSTGFPMVASIKNNTIVNYVGANIYAKFYNASSLSITKNIFYTEDSYNSASYLYAFYAAGTTPSVDVTDNIVYGLDSSKNWNFYHSNSTVKPEGGNVIERYATSPFEIMDLNKGIFTPIPALAGYGATIE